MTDGQGSLPIAADQSFTLDPHSKVLRELPQIGAYQKDKAERDKAEADKKAAAEKAKR